MQWYLLHICVHLNGAIIIKGELGWRCTNHLHDKRTISSESLSSEIQDRDFVVVIKEPVKLNGYQTFQWDKHRLRTVSWYLFVFICVCSINEASQWVIFIYLEYNVMVSHSQLSLSDCPRCHNDRLIRPIGAESPSVIKAVYQWILKKLYTLCCLEFDVIRLAPWLGLFNCFTKRIPCLINSNWRTHYFRQKGFTQDSFFWWKLTTAGERIRCYGWNPIGIY
jgi:hypothetical protein